MYKLLEALIFFLQYYIKTTRDHKKMNYLHIYFFVLTFHAVTAPSSTLPLLPDIPAGIALPDDNLRLRLRYSLLFHR